LTTFVETSSVPFTIPLPMPPKLSPKTATGPSVISYLQVISAVVTKFFTKFCTTNETGRFSLSAGPLSGRMSEIVGSVK